MKKETVTFMILNADEHWEFIFKEEDLPCDDGAIRISCEASQSMGMFDGDSSFSIFFVGAFTSIAYSIVANFFYEKIKLFWENHSNKDVIVYFESSNNRKKFILKSNSDIDNHQLIKSLLTEDKDI